jgi:hypothetical protein
LPDLAIYARVSVKPEKEIVREHEEQEEEQRKGKIACPGFVELSIGVEQFGRSETLLKQVREAGQN